MPPKRQQATSFFERHGNVFVYVPNLIGYCRLILALAAFAVALERPDLCVLMYALSFVCDELDGRFARMFNQTSTFGAVLDMVTDRVATSCLLATLCVLYPALHPAFVSLLMLDIFSHWFQMYATLALGSATHKDVNSHSFVVRMYYKHRIFMGFCCVCVEVLYLAMYMLGFEKYRNAALLNIPVLQNLAYATVGSSGGIPLALAIALAAVPGFAIKQIVNVAQLQMAASQLVELDQKATRKTRALSK